MQLCCGLSCCLACGLLRFSGGPRTDSHTPNGRKRERERQTDRQTHRTIAANSLRSNFLIREIHADRIVRVETQLLIESIARRHGSYSWTVHDSAVAIHRDSFHPSDYLLCLSARLFVCMPTTHCSPCVFKRLNRSSHNDWRILTGTLVFILRGVR